MKIISIKGIPSIIGSIIVSLIITILNIPHVKLDRFILFAVGFFIILFITELEIRDIMKKRAEGRKHGLSIFALIIAIIFLLLLFYMATISLYTF